MGCQTISSLGEARGDLLQLLQRAYQHRDGFGHIASFGSIQALNGSRVEGISRQTVDCIGWEGYQPARFKHLQCSRDGLWIRRGEYGSFHEVSDLKAYTISMRNKRGKPARSR